MDSLERKSHTSQRTGISPPLIEVDRLCHCRNCAKVSLERYNQELKRRTRVVRIFPHQESCLRLVTAMVMEMSEEWMVRRYLIFEDEVSTTSPKEMLAA